MLAHRTLRLVAALALPFALTACGQTHRIKPTDKATPVAVGSVPPTVFPAPTTQAPATESATAAPSGSSAASSAPAGGGSTVRALATAKFEPATLTVKAGTKVTWVAEGYHTANSGTPPTVDASGPIQAPAGFSEYSVTFDKPGTYKYFCQPHASLGMTGEIVVT